MRTDTSTAPAVRQRFFEQGELLALRPVLPEDFSALARLMAQTPCSRYPMPQTAERLRAKYEDGDAPGLFDDDARTYVAIDNGGQLVGYISQRREYPMVMLHFTFEIEHGQAQRSELGRDLLKTYMRYLQRWSNEQHLVSEVLAPEGEKIAWLSACGFELEITQRRAELYRGQAVDRMAFGWMSEELKNAPSWSEGEPDYSRAVRPVRE